MREVIMITGRPASAVGAHVAHQVEAVHARHLDVRQHHHRRSSASAPARPAVLGGATR
jgi:hypothetical protein